MNDKKSGARFYLNSTALVLALPIWAMANSSFGADTEPADETSNKADALSEIIVTGTLIRGVAPVGTNVIDLSDKDIEATGATTTAQLLQEIPQLGSFNSLQFPAAAGNTTTVNRPNLRELPGNTTAGGSTTLVLLDGHRMVGMGVTSTTPDPDVIPPGAIERVDIVPDGGSATYGADAVAGVINFVTRRTFDGVMVDGHYGIGDQYHQWDTNLTAGTIWDGGGAYFSYNHSYHDAVLADDRSYAKAFPDQNGNAGLTCNPGNVQVGNAIYGLPFTGATAVAKPNQCNNALGASLYPSERRDSVFARVAQDVGPVVKVDVTGYFTESLVGVDNGPYQALSPTAVTPASPFFASHQIGSETSQDLYFQINGPGIGAQQIKLDTFGITPSVSADLGGTWQLRLLTNFGESTTTNQAQAANTAALSNAINAGLFNPYDPASSSPAALSAINNFQTYGHAFQRLEDVRLIADGELFHLPAGAVKVAVGGEYYDEVYSSQTGTQVPGTQGTGYAGLSIDGTVIAPPDTPLNAVDLSHHVRSGFGEVDLPIFSSLNALPGLQQLTLSAEGRWDEYSDFGRTLNPKFGFTWKPLQSLSLHGSWGTSFNAPSLADSPKADISTLFVLPESAFGPTGNLLASGGGKYPVPVNGANSLYPFPVVYVTRGNEPNIQPQSARTASLGFDFTPSILPELTVGATWWRIDVSGVIGLPPAQNAQLVYGDYPSVVTLNPSIALLNQISSAANSIPILQPCHTAPINCTVYALVNVDKQNLGDYYADGVDFKGRYLHPTDFGSFSVGVNGTYDLEAKSRSSYLVPFIDQLPDNASRLRLQVMGGMQWHNLLSQVTWDHTGGYPLSPAVGYVTQTSVSAFDVVNLFFKYDLKRDDWLSNTSFTLNVNNIANASPPEFRERQDTTLFTQGFTNGATVGRVFQFGLAKKF
jgi:iron complex outermembrane recepter protein